MSQVMAAAARDPVLGSTSALHRPGKLTKAILTYQEILQTAQSNAHATLQTQAYQPAENLFIDASRSSPCRRDPIPILAFPERKVEISKRYGPAYPSFAVILGRA
jgi:hypothetical protein